LTYLVPIYQSNQSYHYGSENVRLLYGSKSFGRNGQSSWGYSQEQVHPETCGESIERAREINKKMNKGRDDPVDTRLVLTNKHYVELLEQVLLLRKSDILVHEQLARIESKIDSGNQSVAKANASILLQ
jgi:hypothetical protein